MFQNPPGYDGDDTMENKVESFEEIPIENWGGVELIATGPSVTFIEFGAGDSAGTMHEGSESDGAFDRGSWSESQGVGMYKDRGYWRWQGNGMERPQTYYEQIPVAPLMLARNWFLQFFADRLKNL
jgi:hypothetical protein